MKVGQLVVSPPHVRIGRLLRHGAAMLFPFAVIQMVVVTHRLKPLARTSGSFCGGCQERNACR